MQKLTIESLIRLNDFGYTVKFITKNYALVRKYSKTVANSKFKRKFSFYNLVKIIND